MADSDSAASPSSGFQDEHKPGACRQCAESGLDCFAFFGRGAVATGRGVAVATKHAAYPVKEGLLGAADAASNYLHPWQSKQPATTHVPTFRM
eukprot:TRINITY_DN94179_c0_g1_i1.p1 TRINITY_DN94179_c0_g1~~TRINITY_DN94179_c0_g1_i1.p1  ORF type:complete len:108 (+),score=16.81 TRINITY_DN94179_c0_g1_i1:48-326(+)